MKLVDLNLLIYAVNRDSRCHDRALQWLETTFEAEETVALAWVVILGFLRITTRPGVFARPLTPEQAFCVVDDWLDRSNVTLLRPGDHHWKVLQRLLARAGTGGNLTTDAHLAALAIEYDACLFSCDNDFARFGNELQFVNPLLLE